MECVILAMHAYRQRVFLVILVMIVALTRKTLKLLANGDEFWNYLSIQIHTLRHMKKVDHVRKRLKEFENASR